MEKKWNIRTVVMEVTRRCNMSCEHCLRGQAENKDIPKVYIDALMSQVDYIGELTFTGGEPSLVPETLEYVLKSAKRHEVGVGGFYVVTNGKKITEDFVIACLRWYAYCEDNEMTGVELSQDDYHETALDYALLKGLSFFSKRTFTKHENVIPMGNAEDWGRGRRVERDHYEIYDDDCCINVDDGVIYVNCNGEIIAGCDWSYALQPEYKICDISNLSLDAFKGIE